MPQLPGEAYLNRARELRKEATRAGTSDQIARALNAAAKRLDIQARKRLQTIGRRPKGIVQRERGLRGLSRQLRAA